MPKHKTNKFHRITWEENILLVKFGQFMSYYTRRKFYQKILQKMRHESKVFCVCKELSIISIGK